MSNDKVSVLFICLGNICRSPTAEGVFRALVVRQGWSDRIEIDSAGCAAYHAGEPPDRRSQAAANTRGIDLSAQRARQVQESDFQRFDYILCADLNNLRDIRALAAKAAGEPRHIGLFLEFAKDQDTQEIPDPYYGGSSGFDHVLDLCEVASAGLLADIMQQHAKR